MDRSDVINLISEETQKDKYGMTRTTESKREVFCNVSSVSSSEFFSAHQNNLNAEFRFTMFRYDYEGEKKVEYDGKTYSVYRTHLNQDSDEIELYVERKAGTDGH